MANQTTRRTLIVTSLAVALLAGIGFGFILDNGRGIERPSPPSESTSTPGSADATRDDATGYERTEEGAVAAATNFNLLSARDELLVDGALGDAMRSLASPDWADDAEREGQNGYEYVVETYGRDADVAAAVLAYEVATFDQDRAKVRLWLVTTLSRSGRTSVEAAWGIVTTDLAWIDGDWHVTGIESSPGPAPVQLPPGEPEVTARHVIEEFDEFRSAPLP